MEQVVVSSRFRDHPRGLYFLFFSEMWERFSFYGLQALLILYMTKHLRFSDDHAIGIFATYGALIYMTPLLGGWLSDIVLGKRRCIILGGALIALGNFALVLPGLFSFYMGLGFIIMGTGLFKVNVSSFVGDLYKEGDVRRDSGYTLYYVGINIGGFLAPLICGFVGEVYGWTYGFALAGIGMLFGVFIFLKGQFAYENHGFPASLEKLKEPFLFKITTEKCLYLSIFLGVPVISMLLNQYTWLTALMPVIGILAIAYVILQAFRCEGHERHALLAVLAMMFFHTTFFALFHMMGSTLNLFTDRNVDRMWMGYTIPASQFLALNPIFIILLGPLTSSLWMHLSSIKKNPHPPMKFIIGLIQIALGFAALLWGIQFCDHTGRIAMFWLVLANLLFTTSELCISPVGLSMVSKLAPARIASIMMGIWMFSISFANFLAGIFAKISAIEISEDAPLDLFASLATYAHVFKTVMWFGLGMAVILLCLLPVLGPVFRKREVQSATQTEVAHFEYPA